MKIRRNAALKSGETAVLRTLDVQDANAVLALLRKTADETSYMMRMANEWRVSVEREAEIIHAAKMSAREMMLGAFVEGSLVGLCQNRLISDAERTHHRTGMGICVLRAHWRKGVAQAMMRTMIDELETTNLEQIELSVVSTNEAAIALYEKLGFVRYGLLPHAMKYRDGSYADMLLMKRDLREKR